MIRPLRTLLTVLLAALGLVLIHAFGPHGLYSFHHHGRLFFELSRLLVALLCLTHIGFCAVMWAQRALWDATEASTFRFVAIKAMLWGYFAFFLIERPGIDLSTTYLFLLILFSTIDLDIQLVRRYVLKRREERMTP